MAVIKEGNITRCPHCAYHSYLLNITLFMQLGPNHRIFFIADMVTNNAFKFEILKKEQKSVPLSSQCPGLLSNGFWLKKKK